MPAAHTTFSIELSSDGIVTLAGKNEERYSDREVSLSIKDATALHKMLGEILQCWDRFDMGQNPLET